MDNSDIAQVDESWRKRGLLSGNENASCQMPLLTNDGDKVISKVQSLAGLCKELD